MAGNRRGRRHGGAHQVGAPTLALSGGAAKRLAELVPPGHEAIVHLTLTDDHPWAQAFVIISGGIELSVGSVIASGTGAGERLTSIFFGGGTPSLFEPEQIARLLEGVQAQIPFGDSIEITLEANPGTAEQDRFRGFRAAGINRLSIGVQSFDAAQLRQLGRIHDGGEALRAADFARRAGFVNFNLDLMFGLPGQTTAAALSDLQTALGCAPTHLSWYQLTIEPNTVFYSQTPVLPGEDEIESMQRDGMALLAASGEDPAELRRINMLTPDRFPHRTPTGLTYDSGRYAEILERLWSGVQAIMKDPRLRKEPERAPADFS